MSKTTKAFRIISRTLLVILAVIFLSLSGIFVFNRIMLAEEKELLADQQTAQMVNVDGSKMAVFVSGEGDHTLVFMAGAGAACPILDYRTFADRFDDAYRIVIIEKFGYGFSDSYDGPRDIVTRVRQDREALAAAGIPGPYVLCPHSYTGLEAIYWAQQYPEEVETIIGLDMAVPRAYDMYDEEIISSVKSANSVNRILRNLGIVRLFVGGTLPDDFSAEEKKIATAIVCRGYCNETVSNEVSSIRSDVEAIDSKQVPDVPTLLLISDGSVTDGWIGYEMDYASGLSDVETVQLDCGHTVYEYEPDKCEESIKKFIGSRDDERFQEIYVSLTENTYPEKYQRSLGWEEKECADNDLGTVLVPVISENGPPDMTWFCENICDWIEDCMKEVPYSKAPWLYSNLVIATPSLNVLFDLKSCMKDPYDRETLYAALYDSLDRELTSAAYNVSQDHGRLQYTDALKDGDPFDGAFEPDCAYTTTEGVTYGMVPVDRALGSSYYMLVASDNNGKESVIVNRDPFLGSGGQASWLTFIDDSELGFSCLTYSGGDEGMLYRTADGGRTFTQINYPSARIQLSDGTIYNPFVIPAKVWLEDGELYMLADQSPWSGDYYNEELDKHPSGLYVSHDDGTSFEYIGEQ